MQGRSTVPSLMPPSALLSPVSPGMVTDMRTDMRADMRAAAPGAPQAVSAMGPPLVPLSVPSKAKAAGMY
jgi:hypothetical protein